MSSPVRYVAAIAAAAALCLALSGGRAMAGDPAFVTLGVGIFDVFHNDTAGHFRAEFRADQLGFIEPLVGVEGTTDGGLYVFGGFNIDILVGHRWVLSPGFAVGHYSNGSGKDLGYNIEFRSGGEVAYRFDDRSRLGLALHHISNAGQGTHNPGTEIIAVTYSIPIGHIFDSNAK
ncbi:MAG: acyloxyacyl hydrolase [Alphaproteobacteria bacterium]